MLDGEILTKYKTRIIRQAEKSQRQEKREEVGEVTPSTSCIRIIERSERKTFHLQGRNHEIWFGLWCSFVRLFLALHSKVI